MEISALDNDRKLAAIVALDNPLSLARALGVDASLDLNQPLLSEVLAALVAMSGQQATALALDASAGLPAYTNWVKTTTLERPPRLLLRLDITPEPLNPITLPVLAPGWGVENISNNYAVALLELYYHPQEELALQKKQLVAELYDFCLNQKTQLVLKLHVFNVQNPSDTSGSTLLPEVQLTAIQEFRQTAHMLILETPADALNTATLTAELDIPWLAMSGQTQDFKQFQTSVKQALENGAHGFLAGQILWNDISQLKRPDQGADLDQIKTFINSTYRERLESLNQILAETPGV